MSSIFKRIASTLVALILFSVGILSLFPFILSEYNRNRLLDDGVSIEGKIVQIKKVQSEIFDLNNPKDHPLAPNDKENKNRSNHTDEKRSMLDQGLLSGRVEYIINGKSYYLIREKIPLESKIGDRIELHYDPEEPNHAIFSDTTFGFHFLFSSLALFAVCILLGVMIIKYGWNESESRTIE